MNFKRIQWIFLVAFLIFDVIVASTLLVQNRFTVANSTQNRRTMIVKEMRSDAISSVPLSNRQATGYYLSGTRSGDNGKLVQQAAKLHNQNYRFSSGELISDFEEPVKINIKRPDKRLNQVIKNNHLVVLGRNYRYNSSLSDKNTIVYVQTLAGRPLYSSDGQLRFHVNTNHEVTGYTQTYLENMQILRPQATTISQQHAVTWLYKHNLIPNNSQIRWANLAYTKLLSTNTHNRSVYLPTWVVEIKTKSSGTTQRLYVNAFNSTVIKTTPNSVDTDTLNN